MSHWPPADVKIFSAMSNDKIKIINMSITSNIYYFLMKTFELHPQSYWNV
jgi:hypothetical protein